ncbi:hypothetical protein D3C74_450640 [compost metagenome]
MPDEYINAPKPDEPRVGMLVDSQSYLGVVTLVKTARGRYRFNSEDKTMEPSLFRELRGTSILDDTDVDYDSTAEGSAA